MARITKEQMEELRNRYNNLVSNSEKQVVKLDTKNRSFILGDFTRLTTSEFMRAYAQAQAQNRKRGRPKGSGKKDKAVEAAMQKHGRFTINDIMGEVEGVTRVYATMVANKQANVVEKRGRTKVFEYAGE